MRKNIDNIEIVEPPIQELTKKRGGFFRTCLFTLLILLLLLVAGVIAIRVSLGPGPQTLKTLPDNFPGDIPVYDRENIETITYISGRYKNRGMEIAAFFPKIILSPLLARLTPSGQGENANQEGTLGGLWRVVATPVADSHDSIQIEWRDLDTSPAFLISYYKKELEKKNFSLDTESEGKTFRQITFSRADGVSGSMYASWTPENRSRAQYALLTVNTFFDISTSTATTAK